MKQRGLTILLFFFVYSPLYANEYWKKNYAKIDSIALTVNTPATIEQLAFELTNRYSTDIEKYRSIFTWVAHNIAYDCEALKRPSLREIDPAKVISKGKAVCAGYSSVYAKLCELSNLECATISGWAIDKEGIGKQLKKNANHAWNAIKIDNQWYLCDATWGAGSVTQDKQVFSFDFNDCYFCTPPTLFSHNHLPENKKWLLGAKQSQKTFINIPYHSEEAIKLNVQDIKPAAGVIHYKKNNSITFKFRLDADVNRVSIKLSQAKHSEEVDFTSKDGKIEFNYVLKAYSPYLYVYINGANILVYKLTQ